MISESMKLKSKLLIDGVDRALHWCDLNNIEMPLVEQPIHKAFYVKAKTCAYYRPTKINICISLCAAPGLAGRSWSWPGYVIDRTPYGVIAHELGHHVDYSRSVRRSSYSGNFGVDLRRNSGETPLTNYAPNTAEWFAEMFRLFVTNPQLLCKVRPRTYNLMVDIGLIPLPDKSWCETLITLAAPERIINAATNHVKRESRIN